MKPQADDQKRVRVKEKGEAGVWRLAIEGAESDWSGVWRLFESESEKCEPWGM